MISNKDFLRKVKKELTLRPFRFILVFATFKIPVEYFLDILPLPLMTHTSLSVICV